jgi:hypothetical protein
MVGAAVGCRVASEPPVRDIRIVDTVPTRARAFGVLALVAAIDVHYYSGGDFGDHCVIGWG